MAESDREKQDLDLTAVAEAYEDWEEEEDRRREAAIHNRARFEGFQVDPKMLASYGLVLMGVLAGINFLVLQHVPDIDPAVLLTNDNGLLAFGFLCFIIIGLGMYRGQSGLTSEEV